MKGKKGGILLTIVLVILIVVLIFFLYFIYQNIPGEPEQPNITLKQLEQNKTDSLKIGNLSYQVKQFYSNTKFNHNSISYKINPDCDEEKKERMLSAFNELSAKVNTISFYESSDEADIDIACSKEAESLEKLEEGFFIAGEGGAREVVKTERYNVITSGVILLYETKKGIKCQWPNVELHELLHVFGFAHSEDENSLMAPLLESCEQKLDESIIDELNRLYSQENLADLYFINVNAIKKGIYLDFNATIRNSGTIEAENVLLSVFDGGEEAGEFNLGNISFGGGVTYKVTNLKLKSRNSKSIDIIIDSENSVREIDETNNVVKLEFS